VRATDAASISGELAILREMRVMTGPAASGESQKERMLNDEI
jgi:hypothetical protein